MYNQAIKEVPARRAFFAFFQGTEAEGDEVNAAVVAFGSRDGDTAVRRRVLWWLVV